MHLPARLADYRVSDLSASPLTLDERGRIDKFGMMGRE
jgi:hypothetical protein